MGKTDATKLLERQIYRATQKMGVFGCFEVTIGIGGIERVDYMTVDTKGIWRCYEIKTSLADFNSKAKKTFVGHYNYFVLTAELYEQVEKKIQPHIGVYVNGLCVKKPKKQRLRTSVEILNISMIRSLARESAKAWTNENTSRLSQLKSENNRLRKEMNAMRGEYNKMKSILRRKK